MLLPWTGTREVAEGAVANRSIIFTLFLTRCSITRIRGPCETSRPGRKRVSRDWSRVKPVYAYCRSRRHPAKGALNTATCHHARFEHLKFTCIARIQNIKTRKHDFTFYFLYLGKMYMVKVINTNAKSRCIANLRDR